MQLLQPAAACWASLASSNERRINRTASIKAATIRGEQLVSINLTREKKQLFVMSLAMWVGYVVERACARTRGVLFGKVGFFLTLLKRTSYMHCILIRWHLFSKLLITMSYVGEASI